MRLMQMMYTATVHSFPRRSD